MQYNEIISISGFPQEGLDKIWSTLPQSFGRFERISEDLIRRERMVEKIDAAQFDEIKRFVEKSGFLFSWTKLTGLHVYLSVLPVFTPDELLHAPLFECSLDDLNGIPDGLPSVQCLLCDRELWPNPSTVLQLRKSFKGDIVKFKGVFYVSQKGRDAIVACGVTEKVFTPVPTRKGVDLFAITPRCELKHRIYHTEECIGFAGYCECGYAKYDDYFGPPRYATSDWNGDDIAWTPYSPYLCYFSHQAIKAIKAFEPELRVSHPVFLE